MVKVFFPSAAAARRSRKTTIVPIATEPASTSRREGALPDRPVFVPFEALACFTVAGCFIAIAFEIWHVRLEPAVRHISNCIAWYLLAADQGWPAADGFCRTALLLRRRFLQLLHHFVQVEAGRLLPLRILPERRQELADVVLRWNQ